MNVSYLNNIFNCLWYLCSTDNGAESHLRISAFLSTYHWNGFQRNVYMHIFSSLLKEKS